MRWQRAPFSAATGAAGGAAKSRRPAVEWFVICGCSGELAPVAARAELAARPTNVVCELVDAPPNVISPAGLTDRVVKFAHLDIEIVDAVSAGLGALTAVGGSGPSPPRLSAAAGG